MKTETAERGRATHKIKNNTPGRHYSRPSEEVRGNATPSELRPATKLTQHQVDAMRERYARGEATQRELAREYGVSLGHVSHILKKKRWR